MTIGLTVQFREDTVAKVVCVVSYISGSHNVFLWVSLTYFDNHSTYLAFVLVFLCEFLILSL